MDTRTLVDEEYSECGEELGAWIDIFPLDDLPLDANKLFKRIGYWNTARMLAASDPKKGATPFARLAKKILVPLYRRKGPVHYAKKMDRAVLDWDNRDRSSYAEILGVTEREKPLPKAWFEPALLPRLGIENTASLPAMMRCSLLVMATGKRFHQKKNVSRTR